jgi:DNA-binding transcriptional regulator YiaG
MTPDELRARRKRLGLSQPETARALQVPLGTLRNWEQGHRRIPDVVDVALEAVERRAEEKQS